MTACAAPGSSGVPGAGDDPGERGPGAGDPAQPDPAASAPISVVVDGLLPGWLVTTSRLTEGSAPSETTQVSDGSPITLTGAADDVFVATITDGDGALVATQSMASPCTLAHSRQLRVPAQFATIQAAVDLARPGDTVAVADGVYTEAVKMRPGVCLVGAGPRRTFLDARHQGYSLVDLTGAPGAVVSGFTFRGVTQPVGCADHDVFTCSGNWYAAGIYLGGTSWRDPTQDAPPLIINNIFEDNDIGVMLYWRGVAVIRNNLFLANRSGLVANHFQSRTLVANNVFLANQELAIGNQAAYLDIIANVIARSAIGVRFENVQTGFIRCNVFYDNAADAYDPYAGSGPPRFVIGKRGNLGTDPELVDATPGDTGDFHLRPGSPAIDAGCATAGSEPDGTPPDIGAYGGPLASWVTL